jgi:hypothetical protein
VADQFQFAFEPLAPAEPLDPPQQVIEGILAKNRLNVIYGMPGTYKTFIGTSMALAVAYLLDWCGFWTEQCEVLYCAADDPEGPQPRAQAWCQYHEIDPSTGKASIIKRPINFFRPETVTRALADIKAQGKPKFVVIDTFFHSTVGADLSSAKEVLECVSQIRRFMQETGATVLLIHHSPKDGASLYGSIVLLASVDVVIKCETMTDDLQVRLVNERARGEKFKPLAVTLEKVTIQTKPDQRGRTESSQPVVVTAMEAPATKDTKTEKAEASLQDIIMAAIWVIGDEGWQPGELIPSRRMFHDKTEAKLKARTNKEEGFGNDKFGKVLDALVDEHKILQRLGTGTGTKYQVVFVPAGMGRKKGADGPVTGTVPVPCSWPKEPGTQEQGTVTVPHAQERSQEQGTKSTQNGKGENPVEKDERADAKSQSSENGNPDLATEAIDQLMKRKG